MVRAFLRLVGRDLTLALRGGVGSLTAPLFFVLAVALFPLGIGPETGLLARVAPGVLWAAALLAALLSLERLFRDDREDGSLDQLMLGVLPLELVALAKAAAHWLTAGLPLVVAAPALAVLLNLDAGGFAALVASLLLGTPILSLLGALGAALTVGLRRGGALVALLVLPLYVPVLIVGAGAVEGAVTGLGARAHLLVLAGGLVGAAALVPWAAAAALRVAAE